MTQIEKVKALLINSPNGVCSTTFLRVVVTSCSLALEYTISPNL